MQKFQGANALHRRAFLAGTAAATGMLLVPASVRAQPEQATSGGTLRVSMAYNPASLDPIVGRNNTDFYPLFAVYDALISFDPETLELQPMLAKSWEFTDPTTLVLELVEGVEFHDGEPFNAEAVVFHLERCKSYDRSNIKADVATIDVVEATGPYQVTIRTKRPDVSLPAVLSDRVGCIVSPKSVKEAAERNVDRAPVGTGPFKFVEWRDNDLIKVERNPNYWGDQAYLDAIEYRIISDRNTVARTVSVGEADLGLNLPAVQVAVMNRNEKLVAGATPSLIYYSAMFNYKDGPLADIRVRQAMNWALNRPDISNVMTAGLGQAHCSMFPTGYWANDPVTENFYTHDLDRAKALMKEAGYGNGLEIDTWTWSDQSSVQSQEVISGQLADIGIRLNVTPASPPQAMQNFLGEKKGHQLLSPVGGLIDPSLAYNYHFSAGAYRNAGGVELPGYRDLLDKSLTTFNRDERQALLHQLQRFVLENALHLPQYVASTVYAHSTAVKGFVFGMPNRPRFHKVWLDKAA